MELKPGYKQTEVGVIPEDWDCVSIQRAASNATNAIVGGPFGSDLTSSDYVYSGVPVVRGTNMGSRMIAGPFVFVSTEKAVTLIANLASPRDVIFTQRGTLGQVSLVPEVPFENYLISQSQMKVSLDIHRYSPEYVYHYFSSAPGQKQILDSAIQTGVPHTNLGICKKYIFPAPTLAEQLRISAILDDLDSLIEAIDYLLGKKKQIKQAAMQELLTGKRRLPGFEGEWEVKRLGDVAHIKTGSRNNEDKVEDGEYPFFVRSDNVERIGSYSYDCEAVLVPGEGRIGDIFHYIKGRFDVHQRVYAITQFAHEVSGKFVHSYMAMNFGAWAMQNTVKATVDSLRLPTFQTFEMLMPATKEEQDAISGVLTEIDAELASLEARKLKAKMLKEGMMQQLLTGKIRLT